MNYLADFKSFYFRVVLPNTPSYQNYFGPANFDSQIARLIEAYRKAFGNNPFEGLDAETIASSLKINLDQLNSTFLDYSDQIGSGIPKAILNTHFIKFLEFFNKQVEFHDFQTLINKINVEVNSVGRNEDFIKRFREYRRDATGQTKIVNANLLFGDVREDYWTINIGAEKELQYHIHLNDTDFIRYGLGFNIQPSANNRSPVEAVRPFKDTFFSCRRELDRILQDYKFWDNEEDNLKNLNYGTFILYGQELPFEREVDNYKLSGLDFLKLLYDIKHKQFKAYKLIFDQSKKPLSELLNTAIMNTYIELLRFKKQIILQGPPGTGKTRLAKEIAKELTNTVKASDLSDDEIINNLRGVTTLKTVAGRVEYTIVDINPTARNVTLKRTNGTTDNTGFDEVKDFYRNQRWKESFHQNDDRRAAAIAQYLYQKLTKVKLEDSTQFRLIQFHPAYSYEDFVRGIAAKANENAVEYTTENRILAEFASAAHKNYVDSKKDVTALSRQKWAEDMFEDFKEHIEDILNENEEEKGEYHISPSVHIYDIDEEAFRYTGNNWATKSHRIIFSDIIKLYLADVTTRQDAKQQRNVTGRARQHATYYFNLLKKFREFIGDKSFNPGNTIKIEERSFVLIIDEMNRANLPAVLGELIYALEYRGERVEGMYEYEGDKGIILPPNLYIIGTMNTADRSVGHIDYAIRRRFAFVDVFPSDAVIDDVVKETVLNQKAKKLFADVAAIFTGGYLASDFSLSDVQLGHSYFLAESEDQLRLKLKYEIQPLLKEYVKDGILNDHQGQKVLDKIAALNV